MWDSMQLVTRPRQGGSVDSESCKLEISVDEPGGSAPRDRAPLP